MQPYRSLSGDVYGRPVSRSSDENQFTSTWSPFPRSVSPYGINGLSPQSDDVVENDREPPMAQSPIGTENIFDYTRDVSSPPAHIINIFSPSGGSETLLKALKPSPNTTSSEHEFTDEEFESINLPPPALSDHEDFLMGMGGMEDLGNSVQPAFHCPNDSYRTSKPRHQGNLSNSYDVNPIPGVWRPPHVATSPFSNAVQTTNTMNMYGQHQTPPRYSGFDAHSLPTYDNGFAVPPFTSRFDTPTQGMPMNTQNSSSYEGPSFFHGSDRVIRSPTNRHSISKSPLGYRSVSSQLTNQYSPPSSSSFTDNSPPGNQSSQWGEHPYGEHPSRTLFVRNINSNVEEEELKELFEKYGPIRSMYTLCKHRGFVMISYYDIRHAKTAMRSLQNHSLRKRKLDIHYSIPKENPPEKDQNQGTLVVFNLDPSISKEELRDIFGVYGEIKEIRETPHKRHHKFVEFYDVRCAEQAMKALNKTEIKSKRIKIEPSRPGGRKSSAGNTNSREDNRHESDMYSNLSKSAPSPPNGMFSPKHTSNSVYSPIESMSSNVDTSNSLHRRRTSPTMTHSGVPVASQPAWPSSNHRPLRSISLPPGGNPNSPPSNTTSASTTQDRRPREDKRNFTLNIEAVQRGIDRRTTLMIKNIPNKYTQKMLLSTVDETHKGLYDFFYLPIDFKNKCNVGYAFINFIDPQSIVSFYQQLHNTKWEKFNSEKVCNIAYARIQGKESLIAHFQNSSLMSEDKKCRPIIFHSTGPKMGQQAPFPVGSNVRPRAKDDRAFKDSSQSKRPHRSRSYSCK